MARKPVTWKKAIALVKKAGLLSAWTKGSKQLNETGGFDYEPDENVDAASFFELLQVFYCSTQAGSASALKDGYLSHDWRYGQETDDIIAEFCECAHKPGWFKLIENAAADMLIFEDEAGVRHELCGTNLGDVAEFFNERLEECGSDRRFYDVETDGDFYTFICLTKEHYESLAKTGIIPLVGVEPLVHAPPSTADIAAREAKHQLSSPNEFCERAAKFVRLNEIDRALQDYDQAVEMFKDMDLSKNLAGRIRRVEAFAERGKIHFERKNFSQAAEDFDNAVKFATEPETRMMRGRAACVMRGRALTELKKFPEAVESFTEALNINEYDAEAFYYRGECRERMGKWIEAKLDKLRAHQLGFRN